MLQSVINGLPEILKSHICTLEKASRDTTNKTSMCESTLRVVNFDKIPKEYARGRGWRGMPSSNDALYITAENEWYFIEFKNGSVDKSDVFRKIYDSLIMLVDWRVIPDFQFVRDRVSYILVYNSEKYPCVSESESRRRNYAYVMERAKTEERLFGVDYLEGYLFRETHTYSKEGFERRFVERMEREEGRSLGL